MKTRKILRLIFIILVMLAFGFPMASASAHGSTRIGDYQLEIGFLNEPALPDEPNGLDLRVTNAITNQPVTGLENTLQAELIFGASKKTLKIEPQASYSFPGREPSLDELRAELQRARVTAVIGALGLLLAIVALVIAWTRGRGIRV